LGDDPAIWGNLEKVAAVYGQLPTPEKGVVHSAGAQLRNPTTGALMASVPSAPKITPQGYQAVLGPDGTYHAEQIPIGAGNGMGVGSADAGAPAGAAPPNVQFAFAPGTPPEVIAAAKAAAAANEGAQGGPQTLADVQASGKGRVQTLSAPEVEALGLPAGTVAQRAPDGSIRVVSKGDGTQGESSAVPFGDPALTGPRYVESIPQGNREIVKGLLNGTVALPSGTALKNPLWQSALASVKHADPTWNQAAYKQFADTRKFFTVGQGGQLINSINTAAQHLDKLREDIKALDNGNFSDINAIGNAISTHTGGQGVTNFNADLTPVASELAAVYKGKGVPSDEEIRHFRDALKPNMSYGQQMNVIRGWIDLLAGKLNATRNQYRSSMSKLSDPLSVINPRAAEALERITSLANDVSTTGKHAMPSEDTAPIYAPGRQEPQGAPAAGTIEGGYRFKGGDPANQANWEPVQ
jgi:hypothetical protein